MDIEKSESKLRIAPLETSHFKGISKKVELANGLELGVESRNGREMLSWAIRRGYFKREAITVLTAVGLPNVSKH